MGIAFLILSFQDAGGEDVGAAAVECDARQRAWRRAEENRTVRGGEGALMAGAIEAIFFRSVVNGTGSMSADAAEGDVGVVDGAEKDARLDVGGIGEDFEAANGDFPRLRDDARGIVGSESAAKKNPGADGGDGRAGHGEELVEGAARRLGLFLIFYSEASGFRASGGAALEKRIQHGHDKKGNECGEK
jgi:hypothetical protein